MKDSKEKWIGLIPDSWGMNTVFQLFTQVKNKNSDLREQNLLSLSYGKIKRKDIETTDGLLPESFDGYNIIEADDIVLRLTDLQNDQRSLRVGLATERGIVTSAYLTLRNRSASVPKYLYYYLHAFDISKGFYGMGAGVRQGLNWDGLKWLKVLTPPVAEQRRIADFLDRRCAEIDGVIEATKKTIEEYKALKQSIITEAVTKGVRGARPMKDSGIEWIGEIPAEWTKQRLRFLCSIHTGNQDTQDNNPDGKYPFYVRSPIVEHSDKWTFEGPAILMSGDGAGAGRIFHYVDGKYGCHQRVYSLQAISGVNRRFLYYFIKELFYISIETANSKSTVDSVRLSMLQDFPVLIPSEMEQREIVANLEDRVSRIDELLFQKELLLNQLETYKKSVIYEYVTGKREVII